MTLKKGNQQKGIQTRKACHQSLYDYGQLVILIYYYIKW